MKHLGDISKIDGREIEPVDVITFGSPCQDLSVAGKRAGLKHEANGDEQTTRSGLFMEAVRIIKEMRDSTNDKYPRFALWENVPGAFSSNKGEDFRIVLEELIKIIEPDAVMPAVPKKGWAYADHYSGDGWSIAYRVLDTQYWPRTPQRRRRIYLVADFGGQCAGEILFEREGLRGNFAKSGASWEGTATHAERSPGADDGEDENDVVYAVATQQGGAEVSKNGICPTITAAAGMSGNNQPWICQPDTAIIDNIGGQAEYGKMSEVNGTLRAGAQGAIAIDCAAYNQGQNALYNPQFYTDGATSTLVAKGPSAVTYLANGESMSGTLCSGPAQRGFSGNQEILSGGYHIIEKHKVPSRYIVRRLTPTECARLQGFPDRWGHPHKKDSLTQEEYLFWAEVRNTHAAINGKATKNYTEAQMLTWYNKLHTDSAEYKMWGNGIALPCALYVMQGIADALGYS